MNQNRKDNFEELYNSMGQQRYGLRLFALWKVQSGMTTKDVGLFLGKTEKTIRRWRRSYEVGGIESLMNIKEGRGPKARITQDDQLKLDIKILQENRKGGRVKCQDVVRFIEEKYQTKYSKSGVYKILHRLGFAWITSRSKHPKHNQAAQDHFKKNSARRLKK